MDNMMNAQRRQKPDAVTAQVVEQPLMAGMSPDHAHAAVVVAHQAVPVKVGWPTGRAGCANGRTSSSIAVSGSPGKGASRSYTGSWNGYSGPLM